MLILALTFGCISCQCVFCDSKVHIRIVDSNFHKGLVFVSSYAVGFLYIGLFYSLGVLFVDIMSMFNTTRAQTAVIFSTTLTIVFGSGVFNGIIIQRFGVVKCGLVSSTIASLGITLCFFAKSIAIWIICIGVMYGAGLGCAFISSTTAIGIHFSGKRRLFMLSLQTTSGAVSGMLYPYFLRFLVDKYGLRGALLLVGGITMNCIPACLLWKVPTESGDQDQQKASNKNTEPIQQYKQNFDITLTTTEDTVTIKKNNRHSFSTENDLYFINKFPVTYNDTKTRRVSIQPGDLKEYDDKETEENQSIVQNLKSLTKNTGFVIFVMGSALAFPAVSIAIIFIADLFRDKGLAIDDTTFGLFLMNAVNIIARLLPGLLLQVKNIPTMFVPILASLLATLGLLGFAFSKTKVVALIVCVVTGMPLGMYLAMMSVVSTKLVGIKKLPTAVGILFSACSIGSALAGPVNGFIRDKYGSYTIPLYVAVGVTLFSTLLFVIAWVSEYRNKRLLARKTSVFYVTSF